MKTFLAGVMFAGMCLVSAAASAQTVTVDYDKEVDFAKFGSYTWVQGQPASNPFVDKRIRGAIDAQLASKGWTKSDSSPSAIVVYFAAVESERELNGWGSGPRWTGFGTVRVNTILTGQLVVDVYDTETRELVWRGFVSDTVSDNTEKNEKRLNEAVTKLFKQFPPKAH